MNKYLQTIQANLPQWAIEWFDVFSVVLQVVAIMLAAWITTRIARHFIKRLTTTYSFPPRVVQLSRRVVSLLIFSGALLWSLERMGVSGSVLWTAFTGFAAVGAVAFFAAWSVLSNLFCALLIYTTRAFRAGDLVELVEKGNEPGIKGRVLDINLVYTTLLESGDHTHGVTLQLPNSMFFQRALRRWHGEAAENARPEGPAS
ncbi:MAG: mechanosensitive ion channel protein MscS [Candidatus Dactylopiibacterium carminicum]|uniref:Small-conductance mechanosensitive channel n=1 Tax=Candidatus Dactylopiibacterium carminicum TaxID=857335 RepID=A0A272EMM4_9RHOO|nr:mechanosensitive ion channel family protein [Candidatus Dactylopiibacterium carminicum]KAF7597755.1 mechanosensitive ion channel family protein [Candidatus Dactylopiibacterium carminicum]PAS91368.1 MAG: mechanosensitive ion channel protein MscS [Candidatus Dactylopiibacterium carminicum]PAS92345.1 MAG: mechanosensitive ion channel protein MscS [Candidatus Dactylopiibacterium carminicum]PAS95241.1 MAG: mechanosensitive ion channel protein MscS [Candidatus Dactylopiibacterium carminicum]